MLGQLDQEPELGLGERDLFPSHSYRTGLRKDLDLAEDGAGRAGLGPGGPPQQGADARRQLLGLERLGDVVVGARLETGDHVVGVGPGGDHDDRDVAGAAQ